MDDTVRWVLIAIGALTIAGGLFGYFKDTARWAPAIFVAFGVALCGVANIKMSFGPQGGSLEIGQELAATSKASEAAATQQEATVQALAVRLGQVTDAIGVLRAAMDARAVQTSGAPAAAVAVPQLEALKATQSEFHSALAASAQANMRVINTNRKLQAAIQASPAVKFKPGA